MSKATGRLASPAAAGATNHQKMFAMYEDALHLSPILACMAAEITWEKVMVLMSVRHYAMGQTVWAAGHVPSDIGFVLEGQFALQVPPPPSPTMSPNDNHESLPLPPPSMTIKLCDPGASLGAYAAMTHQPLEYAVVADKYKSVLMLLSKSKFKTILKQMGAEKEHRMQDMLQATQADVRERLLHPRVTPLSGTDLPLPHHLHLDTHHHHHLLSTHPVEYESTSGVLVLYEPVPDLHAAHKPRLNPICAQAKANMLKRLERIHFPENYNHLEPPSSRKTGGRGRTFSHPTIGLSAKHEKPQGRLLKPIAHDKHWYEDDQGHVVVHAERGSACALRPTSYDSATTTTTALVVSHSMPSLPVVALSRPRHHSFHRSPDATLSRATILSTHAPIVLHINLNTPIQATPQVQTLGVTHQPSSTLSLSTVLAEGHQPCTVPVQLQPTT
ncbi:Aste57867_12851 [Aphanomyces stellatus]|uniref:Aste57867_12851 protein n=1 Tax=Aphanomyces stellatus TaxID=120398 RepID=A0A485KXF7_9STRA|nr:hypothetical protein As57867_012803 [Aphanomyces stellatus]VFT89698.1 Aste57867_12851 [Aphanomyces stellatus]